MALEYYLYFIFVSVLSLNYEYEVDIIKQKKGSYFFHVIFILALIFLIGFRYEVGGDWSSYIFYYERAQNTPLIEYLSLNEFSYAIINYISYKISGGILLVNTICAIIFVTFLYKFLITLPRPWLALIVAIPYFIIVVSMGFVRQGLAIAIFLYAITYIKKGKFKSYIIWIFIASTFHLSVLFFLPLILLQFLKKNILSSIFGLILILIIFHFNYDLLIDKATSYFNFEMQSSGSFIRSLMNLLPAIIFIIFSKRFRINKDEKLFWLQLSLISIIFSILYIYFPSYTIIDRLGYYLIALQIFVFSYLPGVFGIYNKKNKFWVLSINIYYFTVLLIWQIFAYHNYAWIPYNSYLSNLNW